MNKQNTSYNARTTFSSRYEFTADHEPAQDQSGARPANFTGKPFQAVVQTYRDIKGQGWIPYSQFKEVWCFYTGDESRRATGLIEQLSKANARWPELCLVRWVQDPKGYQRIELANGREFYGQE